MPHRQYFMRLASIFAVEFLWLSIAPLNRADWAVENIIVLVSVIVLGISYQRFLMSRVSYTLIFLFMYLHQIGAHYTYSQVPYESFFIQHFGISVNQLFGFTRNHFDRLVHFLYGLLLVYPAREFYWRIANVRGFWGYFFPLQLIIASSAIYEMFEWGAAEFFGDDLGVAYLGTQGDIWDAHKDMLLAGLGALIGMAINVLINLKRQANFAEEWQRSLTVKHQQPLDEGSLDKMQASVKINH